MKLYITGSPGSGKSRLARQVSEALGYPCYGCDDILYTPDLTSPQGNRKRTAGEYQPLFDEALQQPAWVIEGVPQRKFWRAFEEADKIVVLAFPKRRIYRQILTRWLRQRFGLEKSGYRPTGAMLRQHFVWARDYQKETPFPEKQWVLRSQEEKREFLEGLK